VIHSQHCLQLYTKQFPEHSVPTIGLHRVHLCTVITVTFHYFAVGMNNIGNATWVLGKNVVKYSVLWNFSVPGERLRLQLACQFSSENHLSELSYHIISMMSL